jgi:hypothetical protein
VIKGAFTQARKYLSPEAFLELNDVIVGNFYKNQTFLGYKNHWLLAMDGGFLKLPDHPSIREELSKRAFGPISFYLSYFHFNYPYRMAVFLRKICLMVKGN